VCSTTRIIELKTLPGNCLWCWAVDDIVSVDLYRLKIFDQRSVHQILDSAVDKLRVNGEKDNNSNFKVENNEHHSYVGSNETWWRAAAGYESKDAEDDEDTAHHRHDNPTAKDRLLDVDDVVDTLIAWDEGQRVNDRAGTTQGDDTEDKDSDTTKQKNEVDDKNNYFSEATSHLDKLMLLSCVSGILFLELFHLTC